VFSVCPCRGYITRDRLFYPNILFSTLLSNTLGLCSSLNVRDHDSHPYRTTDKTVVFHILIFMIFGSRRKQENVFLYDKCTHTEAIIYNIKLHYPNIYRLESHRSSSMSPERDRFQLRTNLCGGGVEYLHRDPASRRRRRKGKSQI
jgi:hypothetical protein